MDPILPSVRSVTPSAAFRQSGSSASATSIPDRKGVAGSSSRPLGDIHVANFALLCNRCQMLHQMLITVIVKEKNTYEQTTLAIASTRILTDEEIGRT